jgi:hypothetical protein
MNVLASWFSALQPIIDRLAQQRHLGGPYRTHIQYRLAFQVSNELNHLLHVKSGPQSVTIVDDVSISTRDIKDSLLSYNHQLLITTTRM